MLTVFGNQAMGQTELVVRNGTGCDANVTVVMTSFTTSMTQTHVVPASGSYSYAFPIPDGFTVCYIKGDVFPYGSTDFAAYNPYASCGSGDYTDTSGCLNVVDGFSQMNTGYPTFSFR